MFARLYTNSGDVKTAYSELSKVITGAITNPASLTAFNSATSTIDATQPSNWSEYTTVGSTNNVNAGTAIWFRQRNRAGRWKYASIYRTTSPTNTHKGLLRHYTVDAPSVLASVAGVATNNSEAYGATTEYTVAAGPGYLIVATRLTTNTYFTDAHMWLEYPETECSSYLTLPNHVLYRHFTTGGSYATDATTDIAYSTGIVECAKPGNADVQVLNGGMSAAATTHGTMKPSYFTSFTNTLDSSGSFVAYPFLSLFYESPYQGLLDCSTLTNVWGTGQALTIPNSAAPSGVSLLTCATGSFSDLSSNELAITAAGNTVISNLSPFSSTATWSGYFDGNGDYLSFPINSSFDFGTGSFTIEFWCKRTGTNSTYARYFQTANGDVYTGISIAQNLDTQNQIRVSMGSNGSSWGIFDNLAGTLSDLQWNHCALVRSGSNFTFYVNGVGSLLTTSAASIYYSAASTVVIGGQAGTNRAVNGYFSNVRVIKGTALYTGSFTVPTAPFSTSSLPSGTSLLTCTTSSFLDYSPNNFLITSSGNTTPVATSPFMQGANWSNYFDGNGDYLSLPDNSGFAIGSGNFTIETWIRLTGYSLNYDGVNYSGIPIAQNETTGRAFLVQVWGTANSWTTFGIVLYSNNTTNTITSANYTFSLNTWYHIALVRSGTSVRCYVNGTDVGGGTNSVNVQDVGSNVTIGSAGVTQAAAGYGYYFPGYISNLRVVKGTALYTSNFTPSTVPFPVSKFTSAYGDVITINGSDYAYLRANGSMSYLVPKR